MPIASGADDSAAFGANRAWRSTVRWRSNAPSGVRGSRRRRLVLGLIGIAAVFARGPLRRVVEIPIVVDRVTGEATIQQRLRSRPVPPLEALDKHNLAIFVRAREGYHWQFLQRDFDQVARMAVPAVFGAYSRQFEGEGALQEVAGAEDWRIDIVGVRLAASGRPGNRGEATVTYDKVVHVAERNLPDVSTRHVASVVYQYQPKVLARSATGWKTRSASSSRPIDPIPRSIRRRPEASRECAGPA